MMNTLRQHFHALGCAVAIVALVSGCRSGRIPSEDPSTKFSTSRRVVFERISEAGLRLDDITTYEAKNAKASVIYGGKDQSIRASVQFTRGGVTTLTGRLIFPPINVGSVSVNGDKATIKSNLLNLDKTQKLFPDASELLQSILLGIVPNVYKLFGDSDFSKFDISLTSKGKYFLSRRNDQMAVELQINAADFTIAGIRVSVKGGESVEINVSQYKDFDGHWLPTSVGIKANANNKNQTNAEISISDIRLNQ